MQESKKYVCDYKLKIRDKFGDYVYKCPVSGKGAKSPVKLGCEATRRQECAEKFSRIAMDNIPSGGQLPPNGSGDSGSDYPKVYEESRWGE